MVAFWQLNIMPVAVLHNVMHLDDKVLVVAVKHAESTKISTHKSLQQTDDHVNRDFNMEYVHVVKKLFL